ncbi:MAG: phosphopantetheine-binding protein [Alphaproteobacteria bacterium]
MTAQVFLPDPDGGTRRLYLTRDLGRFGADGCLWVTGRKDDEIKVRNRRVVLGDVEEALRVDRDVALAAVTTFTNALGAARLAAYVVTRDDIPFDGAAIRDRMRRRVPDYMVPSVILPIDALPLTPTGKVDRRRLPAPRVVRRDDPATYVEPRTPLEIRLVEVSEELLGLTGVGVSDDFFAIGGDSLQATQLLIEIHSQFGVELEATDFIVEANTVVGLVRAIEQRRSLRSQGSFADLPATPPHGDVDEFETQSMAKGNEAAFWIEAHTSLRRLRPGARLRGASINSLGFRGPEIPVAKPVGMIRIAFLGSSTTFDSFASSNEAAWPHRAWVELSRRFPATRMDYVNAGVPTYKTRHMIATYRAHVARLDPDVVVIWANDVTVDTVHQARARGIHDGVNYRKSSIARRWVTWKKLELRATIAWRLCRPSRWPGVLKIDPCELTDQFEGRLELLVRHCRAAGPLVVLLAPFLNLRREQSLFWRLRAAKTRVLQMPHLSVTGMIDASEAYRRATVRVADQMGVTVLDLAEAVPGDGRHYVDSSHFSDVGAEAMGRALAAAMETVPAFRALIEDANRYPLRTHASPITSST